MVEHVLAKDETGVRFSYAAQNIHILQDIYFYGFDNPDSPESPTGYATQRKSSFKCSFKDSIGRPLLVLYPHRKALKMWGYVYNYVCIVYKGQLST